MARPRKPIRLARIPGRENWYIRDGRQVVSTGTADGDEAKCFLARYLARRDTPVAPTVSQLLEIRLKDLQSRGVARAANTPYYHAALKKHLGSLRPAQLIMPVINTYREQRKAVPGSLREELLELRMTLSMAMRMGSIDKAPYIDVPARRPPKDRFLSRDQARALLGAAKPMHLRLYLLIAMTTGARKGAILGLTWDRVDLVRGRLDFTDPALAETKKRRTVVPVAGNVIAALRMARPFAETGHVIEYMGKPIKNLKRSFNEAASAAGVPWATPHTLKHSVISWLAEDGFTLDKISDLTATHPDTVRRIYRKFSPEYLEDMAASLEQTVSFANPFVKPVRKTG